MRKTNTTLETPVTEDITIALERKLAPTKKKRTRAASNVSTVEGVSLDAFAGEKKKRKPNLGISEKKFAAGLVAIEQRVREKNYADLKVEDLVFLYAWSHRCLYGVEPIELLKEFKVAVRVAQRCVDNRFGGDLQKVVRYIGWTWAGERERNKTRSGDFRLTWRLQFNSDWLYTNYRVALGRRGRIQ